MSTTPLSITDFASSVRNKYPGAYDKLSDPELVSAVVNKYPAYKQHIASYAETQFEKDRNPDNQPGAISAIGSAIGKAATGLVGAVSSAFDSPADRAVKAQQMASDLVLSDQDRKDDGRSVPYRIAAGIGQATGVADPVSMEKSADTGDVGGILGSAGTSAAMAASPLIAEGAGVAKGAVGDMMRDPYGSTKGASAIKPGFVKAVSHLGKYVGGPEIADYLTPERSSGPTGPYSSIPNRLPSSLRGDPFAPNPAPPAPVYPGASLPSADTFYANRGADIMSAMKQQPDAFSPNPPAAAPTAIGDIPSEEGVPGSLAKPSGRLVLLPQEAQAAEQMQKIAKVRASQHGMQYAAGMRPAGGGRVPMNPTSTVTPEIPSMTPEMLADLRNRLGLQ